MYQSDQKIADQLIEALVFDFDNVIVRGSERCKENAWNSLFQAGSQEFTELQKARVRYRDGKGDRFDILAEAFGLPEGIESRGDEQVIRASQRYDSLVQRCILRIGIAESDLAALLTLCRHYPLYIISATPQPALRTTLVLLSQLHKVDLLTVFKLALGTPARKQENFELVHEDSGVPYARMLMIGDGQNDYEAAVAKGTLFAGVITDGNRSRWNDAPFSTIASIEELSDLLRLSRNPS